MVLKIKRDESNRFSNLLYHLQSLTKKKKKAFVAIMKVFKKDGIRAGCNVIITKSLSQLAADTGHGEICIRNGVLSYLKKNLWLETTVLGPEEKELIREYKTYFFFTNFYIKNNEIFYRSNSGNINRSIVALDHEVLSQEAFIYDSGAPDVETVFVMKDGWTRKRVEGVGSYAIFPPNLPPKLLTKEQKQAKKKQAARKTSMQMLGKINSLPEDNLYKKMFFNLLGQLPFLDDLALATILRVFKSKVVSEMSYQIKKEETVSSMTFGKFYGLCRDYSIKNSIDWGYVKHKLEGRARNREKWEEQKRKFRSSFFGEKKIQKYTIEFKKNKREIGKTNTIIFPKFLNQRQGDGDCSYINTVSKRQQAKNWERQIFANWEPSNDEDRRKNMLLSRLGLTRSEVAKICSTFSEEEIYLGVKRARLYNKSILNKGAFYFNAIKKAQNFPKNHLPRPVRELIFKKPIAPHVAEAFDELLHRFNAGYVQILNIHIKKQHKLNCFSKEAIIKAIIDYKDQGYLYSAVENKNTAFSFLFGVLAERAYKDRSLFHQLANKKQVKYIIKINEDKNFSEKKHYDNKMRSRALTSLLRKI